MDGWMDWLIDWLINWLVDWLIGRLAVLTVRPIISRICGHKVKIPGKTPGEQAIVI